MNEGYKKIYPWVLVGLLWGVGLLNYMDRQMFATMQDAMAIDIPELNPLINPSSSEAFGFLMSIFLYVYAPMSPIAGLVADKVNRKWLIVGSLFVWSGVTFCMGLATTYNQLIWLRGLMGVSEALYLPTGLAMLADFHRKKTRSKAIGIHQTGIYLGSALGGFGATIAAAYTWHFAFHTFGIIGIIYSLFLLFLLKEKTGHAGFHTSSQVKKKMKKPPLLKAFAVLFTNISFWVILLYFAVPSLPGWATKNWLPTLFHNNLSDMSMAVVGPLSTITLAVPSFVGVLFGGWLSDKWVQKNIKGRVFTGAIGIGLMIPGLILLGFGHSLIGLVGAGTCFGLGFGMYDANNMPILCQFVSDKYRGTAYGIMNMVGVFFGAFVTDFLGKATDAGNLGRDFAILGGIVLIALIVQVTCLNPKTDDFVDAGDLSEGGLAEI